MVLIFNYILALCESRRRAHTGPRADARQNDKTLNKISITAGD